MSGPIEIFAAILVYFGMATGIALFLHDSEKVAGKTPDPRAALFIGAIWPVLIIGLPVFVLLRSMDRAGK